MPVVWTWKVSRSRTKALKAKTLHPHSACRQGVFCCVCRQSYQESSASLQKVQKSCRRCSNVLIPARERMYPEFAPVIELARQVPLSTASALFFGGVEKEQRKLQVIPNQNLEIGRNTNPWQELLTASFACKWTPLHSF